MRDRICPECGADKWKMRDADRVYDENRRLRDDVRKLAADKGILTYEAQAREERFKDAYARLQRKLVKQARVIVRLEGRLRELKVRPHEDASFSDVVTGAEYDADTPLPGEGQSVLPPAPRLQRQHIDNNKGEGQ